MSQPPTVPEEGGAYKVLVNEEGQYSVWPARKENPAGWGDAGKVGDREECLAYVKEVWTDLRPLSLRKGMEEPAARPVEPPSKSEAGGDLVGRLCEDEHRVEVDLRPEKNVGAFKEALERGYLPLTFTDTRGGTSLRVRLDRAASDFAGADFETGGGTLKLVGGLTLDSVNVRCVATIDLRTLAGRGRLERVEARPGA